MLVLAFAVVAIPAPATAAPPSVTIAVVPHGTTPSDLARIDGMSVGLMSAGIGRVPAVQTYLDISQGSRLNPSLYDDPLPLAYVGAPRGREARVAPEQWSAIRDRAVGAPADLVPGLLGQTLREAGSHATAMTAAGEAALTLVDTRGRVASPGCVAAPCFAVRVVEATPTQAARLARHAQGKDLLIAIERPPPERDHGLAIGIAGSGFDGNLTSDSTRIDGLVTSTDVAPTILDRLGIPVPDEMTGEPIRSAGASDAGAVESLGDRLAEIGPRRGPVIGLSVLAWVVLTAVAGLALGVRGLRMALPLLALAMFWFPAVLLLTAALSPSQPAEQLIAVLGCPALAFVTARFLPGYRGLAVAGGVSVLVYGADVVAAGGLTELSLLGPSPIGGARFYGIGNEFEATAGALVPIATAAALVGWGSTVSNRTAAVWFGAGALLAAIAFAPGRFGADVGAAITIPVGAAVAAAVCLGAGGRRAAWVVAAPIGAVAALLLVDVVTAGDSHLTRSVVQAGGLHDVGDVLDRRLRLSAESFTRYAPNAILWITVILIVLGVAQRRRIASWFDDRRALAGLAGAAAATLVGTLANDSGALLLMIGTAMCAIYAGFGWATSDPRV